jgi:hypothetical protein
MEITKSMKSSFIDSYKSLKNGDSTEDFIESLQCAIVRAGGCFIPRSVLGLKSVSELNEILTPNHIPATYISQDERAKL